MRTNLEKRVRALEVKEEGPPKNVTIYGWRGQDEPEELTEWDEPPEPPGPKDTVYRIVLPKELRNV